MKYFSEHEWAVAWFAALFCRFGGIALSLRFATLLIGTDRLLMEGLKYLAGRFKPVPPVSRCN